MNATTPDSRSPFPDGSAADQPSATAHSKTTIATGGDDTATLLLEARGISRSFNGRRVLGPVTLPVRSGSVHAVLGKNGAGKSTLMKILSGFDRPDTGEVRVDGEPVSGYGVHAHERSGIAFVPQELTVFPGLTVADHVLLGDRYPRRMSAVVRRRRGEADAARTLQQLHLDIDTNRIVDTLTVAELRSVMIGRALHLAAKVLILDEPTEAFAAPEVDALFEVVRKLRDRGMGIVYVSHRLSEVFSIADTVTVLRDGAAVIDAAQLTGTTADDVVSAIVNKDPLDIPAAGAELDADRRLRALDPGSVETGPAVSTMDSFAGGPSIELRSREVVGLAGLVGSGRTALLKRAAGLEDAPSSRAGVTFLPEDRAQLGILPGLTVRENITVAQPRRYTRGGLPYISRRQERLQCRLAMRQVGLPEDVLETPIDALSGGSQQKALLARGLFGDARVWLLDEPTVGLDIQSRHQVLGLVRLVAQGLIDREGSEHGVSSTGRSAALGATGCGSAVVVTSSDLDDLIGTCDAVHLVKDGQLLERLEAPLTEEELTMLTAFADDGKALDQ